MISVIDCLKVMLQASHASSKLRELNNDTLCIDNVLNILIMLMVMSSLNFCLLRIWMAILVSCKE